MMVSKITSLKSGQAIQPFDSELWRPKITVPQVPPTNFGGCRIINLDYAIKVKYLQSIII